MAYSTGSGTYTALMAAVLVHAVTDGWIEAGGIGTGWPISKGQVRGVDWTSYTASEDDLTLGGDGLTKTQRYIRIGIGATTGGATTNAGTTTCIFPNAAYTFSEWYIFSDTTTSDYIHVVIKFNNGVNADCYGHFSFGELDKGGLTYNSIAYATAWGGRGYAVTADSGINSQDWNSLNRCRNGWSGAVGEGDDGSAIMSFMIHATTAPTPNGASGWPSWDTLIENGEKLWGKGFRYSIDTEGEPQPIDSTSFTSINWNAWVAIAPSQTGTITLMPIPFLMINSTGITGRLTYCGTFPDVRKTNVIDVAPGEEIVYGSEIWKIFPLLRKSAWNELNDSSVVTSGYAGIAFKKVV